MTKQDLLNSETKLNASIEQVESTLNESIARLDSKLNAVIMRLDTKVDTAIEHLEHKILQSEYRMTIKLGTIVTVVMAAATAAIKLL